MTKKAALQVFLGIGVLAVWALGLSLPAAAETLHYKAYVWMDKSESVVVDEAAGVRLSLVQRGGIYACDTGEVATMRRASLNEVTKEMGAATMYETIKFPDGSTILLRAKMENPQAGGQATSYKGTIEILKGTGRFAGIKGTGTYDAKALPAEKGDVGSKQYGEGTLTYTLPPK
jgi:hypothetical protein